MESVIDTHAIARQLSGAGLSPQQADVITDAIRQVAEHGDYATWPELESLATKVDLANLEARLTWRFAGATLAILGGVLAMLRLLA